MPTVWEQVTHNAKLISLPDVYFRLKSVMDDPDYSMADVSEVISHDPAMTMRLLRLVNSAYFGFAAKIDTVNRAVGMLGAQQVHDLVLATSVAETFKGMSNPVMGMERFWIKSVTCAVASRELAVLCNILDSERVFVAGLLRDIGHLIMYQAAPGPTQQALEHAHKQGVPLYKVERVLLGICYAKVGGSLMRQWQLPRSLWEPTEFHVEPEMAKEYPLITAIVQIAGIVADAMQNKQDLETALASVHQYAWQVTDLDPQDCLGLQVKVEKQLPVVMNLIFPAGQKATA